MERSRGFECGPFSVLSSTPAATEWRRCLHPAMQTTQLPLLRLGRLFAGLISSQIVIWNLFTNPYSLNRFMKSSIIPNSKKHEGSKGDDGAPEKINMPRYTVHSVCTFGSLYSQHNSEVETSLATAAQAEFTFALLSGTGLSTAGMIHRASPCLGE